MKEMPDSIIMHYDEICLKGKNRGLFERKLADNARKALGTSIAGMRLGRGRIVAKLAEGMGVGEAQRRLSLLPGIVNFSFAATAPLDIEKMETSALQLLEGEKPPSFMAMTTRP